MTRKRIQVAAGIVLALVCLTGCKDEPDEPPDYVHLMPLALGNKWTYDVEITWMNNPPEDHTYEYEVTDVLENYEGMSKAYVITERKDGVATSTITVAYREDCCVLYTWQWLLLLKDKMSWGDYNETGLLWHEPFAWDGEEKVTCPAGEFPGCTRFRYNYGEVIETREVNEYYAKDVGLVRFDNSYELREQSMPHQPYEWGKTTYLLKSYVLHNP